MVIQRLRGLFIDAKRYGRVSYKGLGLFRFLGMIRACMRPQKDYDAGDTNWLKESRGLQENPPEPKIRPNRSNIPIGPDGPQLVDRIGVRAKRTSNI